MQQAYYCPNCRSLIDFGARFCGNCGTPLIWPTQQWTPPPPVYQQPQQQYSYGYRQPKEEPEKKQSSPIGCLGLIVIVFLIVGAIFALRETNTTKENLPEYIHQYENKQPPVLTASRMQVNLRNTPDAKNISFTELKSFIRRDDTSEKLYLIMHCVDFAELLHNNAERAGIKAAFVTINFKGEEIGHALNAFKTTDKGLVYIDCTGTKLKLVDVTTIKGEKISLFDKPRPGEYDKVAYIEKGKEYGVINIDKAESLDYGFYVEYIAKYNQELQKLDGMVDDFKNEVRAFNRALGGRTALAEPEYSRFKAWETKIDGKKRTILELAEKLDAPFEPLGIVETVKIYW